MNVRSLTLQKNSDHENSNLTKIDSGPPGYHLCRLGVNGCSGVCFRPLWFWRQILLWAVLFYREKHPAYISGIVYCVPALS